MSRLIILLILSSCAAPIIETPKKEVKVIEEKTNLNEDCRITLRKYNSMDNACFLEKYNGCVLGDYRVKGECPACDSLDNVVVLLNKNHCIE